MHLHHISHKVTCGQSTWQSWRGQTYRNVLGGKRKTLQTYAPVIPMRLNRNDCVPTQKLLVSFIICYDDRVLSLNIDTGALRI